jgi:hypothetical protein
MTMRVECGSCKRVAEARFERAGDTDEISVTCSSCGIQATAPVTEKVKQARAITVNELCPKCGTIRVAGADACRACGIASARMATFAAERDAAVPEEVRRAWTALDGAWTEIARHDAMLAMVARHNCYAWAAGRYRDASRARTGDSIAVAQLDRLRRAGEATMFASASARPEQSKTPYTSVIAILGIMMVAIVGGLVYMGAKTNEASAATPQHFSVQTR